MIAGFLSLLTLIQAYAVPLILSLLIGLATARWIMPRRPATDAPPVKDLRDL